MLEMWNYSLCLRVNFVQDCCMRKRFELQLALGATPIEEVKIPTRTRDELPPTLAALQWVFTTPEVSAEVFNLLEEELLSDNNSKGRVGMDLWQILVLGVVRLTLDINYDRLHHVANYDSLVRQLLGQPALDMELEFKLSTLKDNVALLSEELLEQINTVIVRHGGGCIKKKEAGLALKVDSYVFESNVHFPTDLSLGLDSARKCIVLSARLSQRYALGGWRKHANWQSKIKRLCRSCARACRNGGKNKAARIEMTAGAYLESLYALEQKVLISLGQLGRLPSSPQLLIEISELKGYYEMLIRQIILIGDRLLQGRTIHAHEKLYSIFEQHTEWIQKGKARPRVELGHRLLIVTDQYGIVHEYKIMHGGDEAAEVAPLADRLIGKLGLEKIASLSFDRGFSSIENRELLELCMPETEVVMPKKGKLSAADKERESQKHWRVLANKHSAVESTINSLEHHGLDRCPDKGYPGYARYAALGILAYNLHRIGNHLIKAQKRADTLGRAA